MGVIRYIDKVKWFESLVKKNLEELNKGGITNEMICKALKAKTSLDLPGHKNITK
jgi:hypothetical protein